MPGRLLHLVMFAVGMLGTAAWLHTLEVLPFWSWSRTKLDHLRRSGDRYDTVFLGSSRMHYGLDPTTFDAEAAAAGTPTRSFNCALSGLRMHDTLLLGEWLLDHKPAGLQRLIVELHGFEQTIRGEQWLSDQEVEMHPPAMLGARLRSLQVTRQPHVDRVAQLGYLLVHTLVNALRVGQGTRIATDRVALANGWSMPGAGKVADAGWMAIEADALPHMRAGHAEFVADGRPFEDALRIRLAEPVPPWLRGGFRADLIAGFAARAAAAGVTCTFVVMPTLAADFHGRDEVDTIQESVRVVAFDRPVAHRALYEPEWFYDPSHLTTAGARAFSRRLARCLAQPAVQGEATARELLSDHPVTLAAEWRQGELILATARLPFVGEVIAMVAERRGASPLGEQIVLGLSLPPLAQTRLSRTGTSTATGRIDGGSLPTDRPLFVQAGVVHTTGVICLSEVVELPPPR